MTSGKRISVAHLVYALRTGGLENILVSLINELPADRFRHTVFCLTNFDEEYRRTMIRQPDCEVIALNKRPQGSDPSMLWRLAQHLRRLKPDVFHSHNLGPMEGQWAAALAGVPRRVHTEHGRDTYDLDGTSLKYNLFRRATRPLIHQYTAVSKDLAEWLVKTVWVPRGRVRQIYTGIDTERYRPGPKLSELAGAPPGFFSERAFVIGTVGRLAEVKDQGTLIEAFAMLRARKQQERLRLMIVGEGHMRPKLEALLDKHRLGPEAVWMAGNRTDIPQLLRQMDLYTLPSTVEGISISILEAMATGLPVLATRVGGNPEIVSRETGVLVPAGDPVGFAEAAAGLIASGEQSLAKLGAAGRAYVLRECTLDAFYGGYRAAYDPEFR